jgi:membrane protein
MPNLWTLGRLSFRDLLRRTWTESWHDAVFGQAGRMAFYHFLAIFPSLLVFLSLIGRMPSVAPEMKAAIAAVGKEFLPEQTSSLVQQLLGELDSHMSMGLHFLSTCAGALWASLNGTWALVYGLNTAYEVEERRPWWKLGITIVGLTFSLASAGLIALILLFFGSKIARQVSHQPLSFNAAPVALRGLEWAIVIALLMFSFAVVYRFAPNLRDPEWKWSTPGAVCAMLLWLAATVGLRFYFHHINDYRRAYGHLNSVAMLLLWLYLTNGAILIGGEMNSEIEKAAAERKSGERRSGS